MKDTPLATGGCDSIANARFPEMREGEEWKCGRKEMKPQKGGCRDKRYILSSDIYKHCTACLDSNHAGKLKGKAIQENI